ncbi:MAG: RluA family pseudouridine synthase [Atopobiaceae bacterium]|nr:RluA family pseudouridine synthase [Atopobiaceae bacterium]
MGALCVIYEDEFLLAVDKPAGLLVHGDGTGAPTLTDLVRGHVERSGRPSSGVQAVQRLDVETTGLVLFSLDKSVQASLDAQVAGRGMHKRYLAVVRGRFPGGTTTIDRPLGRDRHDARRMRVSPGGKPSQTLVTKLGEAGGLSVLAVELLTGRRHQIRVHLAAMGFPLVGDALYGGARSRDGLMLHAYEERLAHPVTGEELALRTELPARFAALMANGIAWPA